MKHTAFLLAILFTLPLAGQIPGQGMPCFVETTVDTVTAYKSYFGAWKQEGFSISKQVQRDSIGVRLEKVYRVFYMDTYSNKVYTPFVAREYISGTKDVSLESLLLSDITAEEEH